jgi:hypothetical protein
MSALGLVFYFKFSFIFLLFILNIYLIVTYKKGTEKDHPNSVRVLQAGFGNKNLKGFLSSLGLAVGFLSALITVKNELKDIQIGKIDQLNEEEREGIRKSIDKDREIHKNILDSMENNRKELYGLHIEKAKLVGHNDRLLTLHNNLKSNVISYQEKSTDSSTKLSELGILDQLIKQDTNKFSQELNSLILQIESSYQEDTSTFKVDEGEGVANTSLPSSDVSEQTISSLPKKAVDLYLSNEFKESIIAFTFFNFEFSSILNWFEGLNGIKKIAACLILGKSIIFSALVSIIFIFYGNILIERYDLIKNYPKLAKIIQLRQKFQKYYFKYCCFIIITAITIEVAFGIAILLL